MPTDRLTASAWRRLKDWARAIKRDVLVLWLAARDPRTPWMVKLLAGLVAAYALSPIDLIPDFVPVLGYLDDLLIVPVGIWLVLRLIPAELLRELRERATAMGARPVSRIAAGIVVGIWLGLATGAGILVWRILGGTAD